MMLKLLRDGHRRLLDASILFSFDRSGYHRHSRASTRATRR